ncbi:MAG: DEAD/DEAH box helicase family protein [Bacteroidales bacterium]|nr:DEAD/DEAH box helicase family protein [Bacteroidales bacterium]
MSNDKPYVLCVPYVSLIKNKLEWCNERGLEVLAVYADEAGIYEIEKFSGSKIIVTYNSLHKVVQGLGEKIKDYKILIDEYHLLVNSGSFRYDAVNEVLKLFREFGDYVFMTATPVQRKYLPKVLQEIPEITMSWENVTPVTIDYTILEDKHLYPAVAKIANHYIQGDYPGNAYFFLNSVRSIIDIVSYLQKTGVTENDVRIICSNQDRNLVKINEALGGRFAISSTSDFPKKLNYITSTAFEGCDIFDTEGVTYIISDGKKGNTKYDVMTTIPQIIGRIRDTKYKNWAKLIFSPSEYFNHTTEAEFERTVLNNLSEARKRVETFNSMSEKEDRDYYLKGVKESGSSYFVINGDMLEVNETAKCAELQNFAALHTTYYVKRDKSGKPIQKEGSKKEIINGREYNVNSTLPDEQLLLNRLEAVQFGIERKNFHELVDLYFEKFVNVNFLPDSECKDKVLIDELYPLIPEAMLKLGYDRIRALKYNQRAIRAEILKATSLANPVKVRKLLNKQIYRTDRRITYDQIKSDLQEVYDDLGIRRTAKATDIKSVFDVKECKIKRNGSYLHAYKIIAIK